MRFSNLIGQPSRIINGYCFHSSANIIQHPSVKTWRIIVLFLPCTARFASHRIARNFSTVPNTVMIHGNFLLNSRDFFHAAYFANAVLMNALFFQRNIFFTRSVHQLCNYSMLDRVSHAPALTKKRAWVSRPLSKLAYFRTLRDAIRGTVCTTLWACWMDLPGLIPRPVMDSYKR